MKGNTMFATFDIDAALTDYEFAEGISEKIIDRSGYYQGTEGELTFFSIKLFATTNAKYARVEIHSPYTRKNLASFGGAIRHYLYTSAKANGPIRGRNAIGTGRFGYSRVDYIIDNPFYTAN